MPRNPRLIFPHIPHHVIHRGNNRQRIFLDSEDFYYYRTVLAKHAERNGVAIGAYCLMTNHVHLLLYPDSGTGLIQAMKFVSQLYSQYMNKKYKRSGKLWENRYKLQIIDPEREWVVARYIEKNPVRAGMVKRGDEYSHSSGQGHLCGRADDLLTKDILRGRIESYREYFYEEDPEQLRLLRLSSAQEKVFGAEDFIRKMEEFFKTILHLRPRGRPGKPKAIHKK